MIKQNLSFFLLGIMMLFSYKPTEINTSKKNIILILILADDLGVSQLGCYGSNFV